MILLSVYNKVVDLRMLTEVESVYCAVRTDSLCKTDTFIL